MSQFLAELNRINEAKEQAMLLEKQQAFLWLIVERGAGFMQRGGFKLSIENIADFCYLTPAQVQEAIDWRIKHKKKKPMPFELDSEHAPASKLDRVKAALFWTSCRTTQSLTARRVSLPAGFKQKYGIMMLVDLTGIGRQEFLEIVDANMDDIKNDFPEFKGHWVQDSLEVRTNNAKNQHRETKMKLIRAAILDISGGRIGTVTAEQIAKWKNGAVGLGARTIDDILSGEKSMFDLDKYRANGKHNNRPTDKDREIAYQRSKND